MAGSVKCAPTAAKLVAKNTSGTTGMLLTPGTSSHGASTRRKAELEPIAGGDHPDGLLQEATPQIFR
jgi:hypothetical protein